MVIDAVRDAGRMFDRYRVAAQEAAAAAAPDDGRGRQPYGRAKAPGDRAYEHSDGEAEEEAQPREHDEHGREEPKHGARVGHRWIATSGPRLLNAFGHREALACGGSSARVYISLGPF